MLLVRSHPLTLTLSADDMDSSDARPHALRIWVGWVVGIQDGEWTTPEQQPLIALATSQTG